MSFVMPGRVVAKVRRGRRAAFPGSSPYWERRYRCEGTSGAGSYGRLADFKAEVINRLVVDLRAGSVVEWGSGDGAQLARFEVEDYLGIDASKAAVRRCRERFDGDPSRRFLTTTEAERAARKPQADLALSLDVVYHLVEDEVYDAYMMRLFGSARLGVVIYSSNWEDDGSTPPHMRHRRFTDWVEQRMPNWQLRDMIPNRYPFDPQDPDETSFADFYVFVPASHR